MPDAENAAPFHLLVTPRAEAESDAIETWLKSLPFSGTEAAERFSETLDRELPALCADLAERFATGSNLPRPDEEASLAFSRPAYRHTFTTSAGGRRKKRQTTGVYVLFYDLTSQADTVNVITIRHGAAEPLTAWISEPNSGSD